MASWADSCPLNGTCSECGLRFAWQQVVYADRLVVPGFFEHARGTALPVAWRTWTWTLWPAVFWKRVRLERPIRPRRAWLWLFLTLLTFQLAHIAFDGWCFWRMHAATSALPKRPPSFRTATAPDWSLGLFARWLDPLFGSPEVSYLYVNGTPPNAPFSFRATAEDIFAWCVPGWEEWPQYAVPTCCFSLALPVMLLFLPDTRKVSKIRPVHIVRAFLYSQAWLVALAAVRLFDQSRIVVLETVTAIGVPVGGFIVRPYHEPILLPALGEHPLLTGIVLCAWLSIWWWYAVSRGFRTDRSALVFLAILAPSLLALLISACLSSYAFGTLIEDVMTGKLRF